MRRLLIIILFGQFTLSLSAQLNGGSGDGFTMGETISLTEFYTGGSGDGYKMEEELSHEELYVGGSGDGYNMDESIANSIYFYTGGSGDGYDSYLLCATFTWIGAVGSSWSNKDNWEQNELPCNCNPVLIPADATRALGVNAGVLAIGHISNNVGNYKAHSITVEEGASILTRINCFVENYGEIKIDGFWNAKNQANNAFLNYGEIIVGENGTLKVGEN